MKQPMISVVVPVLNSEERLPRLLDSILVQSLDDIEVVCVDNGSADRSQEIIERYSERDPRVVSAFEPKRGSGAARNKGLDIASGRYCIFFDSDDFCPNPDAFQALAGEADEQDADVVRGNHLVFTEETGETSCQRFYGVDLFIDRRRAVNWLDEPVLWVPWTHTVFIIKKQFLLENRIRYPDYLRGQDPPFLLQVFLAAKTLYCIPDVVYIYRNSRERWSNFVWTEESCEHYLRHFGDVRRLLRDNSLERQWRVYATWGVRKLAELLPVAVFSSSGRNRRLIIEIFSDLWGYHDIDPAPFQAEIQWDLLFFSLFQCHQIEKWDIPGRRGVRFLGAEMRLENGRVARLVQPAESRPVERPESIPLSLKIKLMVAKVLTAIGLFGLVRRAYRSLKGRAGH